MAEKISGGRDLGGSVLGILTFLGGIAMLGLTFKLAYDLFTQSPTQVLGITPGKPLDLGSAGASFLGVAVRMLLLVIMAVVGSAIANRGATLYAKSAHLRVKEL